MLLLETVEAVGVFLGSLSISDVVSAACELEVASSASSNVAVESAAAETEAIAKTYS